MPVAVESLRLLYTQNSELFYPGGGVASIPTQQVGAIIFSRAVRTLIRPDDSAVLISSSDKAMYPGTSSLLTLSLQILICYIFCLHALFR